MTQVNDQSKINPNASAKDITNELERRNAAYCENCDHVFTGILSINKPCPNCNSDGLFFVSNSE